MTHIVTIGGGHGQSDLLDALRLHSPISPLHLSSVISMSDDGRTTGELMRLFRRYLHIHLPPPGDIRRQLYTLSCLPDRKDIEASMERVLQDATLISDYSIADFLGLIPSLSGDILEEIRISFPDLLTAHIQIPVPVRSHKVGNLLMGALFATLGNMTDMLSVMKKILKVEGDILPVTFDPAYIEAHISDGQVVKTQDQISNFPTYSGKIVSLQLMEGSRSARINPEIGTVTNNADLIIVTPGDIYTSLISNLIIPGVPDWIRSHPAKFVCILNPTNKGGEAAGMTSRDMIQAIETYAGRPFDAIIANNTLPTLSEDELIEFSSHISIKGGAYITLTPSDRDFLHARGTQILEGDLLTDEKSETYRYDKKKLVGALLTFLS